MLRNDLAKARNGWLTEAIDDPQEYAQRQQSDFLADTNHEGEITDFHCLRHTCGAWLAMTGAHPKVVQTVMRHSTITLTMDTYGHLFPGQEADAVDQLRKMLAVPPEALQATGTDNATADTPQSAQHQAQQSGRETQRSHATRGDDRTKPSAQQESPKPLQIADLGDVLLPDAMGCESRRGGIRTPDQGISSHGVARSKPKR